VAPALVGWGRSPRVERSAGSAPGASASQQLVTVAANWRLPEQGKDTVIGVTFWSFLRASPYWKEKATAKQSAAHQLRQLSDIDRNSPRLVAGEQFGRVPPAGLVVEEAVYGHSSAILTNP
jgi:hypothetical protein